MLKISEMTTEKATDVICEIVPFIEEIVSDDEFINTVKEKIDVTKDTNKFELYTFMLEKITKVIPIMLKKKRNAVYGILAAFNEKSIDEIAKQNIIITISQINTLVKDKELTELFTSLGKSEKRK